jgi:hypothetical protein
LTGGAITQPITRKREFRLERRYRNGRLRSALLADGCVSDPAVAGRLVDDLLAAHKQHLPQFA